MTGQELLLELKTQLGVTTDAEIARCLGVTSGRIAQIRRQKTLTPRVIATAIKRTRQQAVQETQRQTIQPIVEFFPTEVDASQTTKRLFSESGSKYKQGLKTKLKDPASVGIYVFYDSQGKAIYAGKTEGQNLWKEMNLALNRRRGADVQNVYRVSHPERSAEFKPGFEMSRQIKMNPVGLWELVAYFSAYLVHSGMIGDIEALLVRAFANDLLNKKMERFQSSRGGV